MYQSEPTDQVLQDFYDETKETNIGKLQTVSVLSEAGAVDSAIDQNAQVTDTNLIEYNTKVVNEIYFQATQSDTLWLTPQQISVLESIAYQNPMEGGEAVYRARAMLRIDIPDSYSTLRKGRKDLTTIDLSFQKYKIYPNPASNYFVIQNSIDFQKREIQLLILDNTGRIVFNKIVSIQTTVALQARELMQGSYQIQIKDDERTEIHKLIIVR